MVEPVMFRILQYVGNTFALTKCVKLSASVRIMQNARVIDRLNQPNILSCSFAVISVFEFT